VIVSPETPLHDHKLHASIDDLKGFELRLLVQLKPEVATDPECQSPAGFCVFLADPGPESLLFSAVAGSLSDLYESHFLSKNIFEIRLYR